MCGETWDHWWYGSFLKWVYRKPQELDCSKLKIRNKNGWFGGTPILGNIHMIYCCFAASSPLIVGVTTLLENFIPKKHVWWKTIRTNLCVSHDSRGFPLKHWGLALFAYQPGQPKKPHWLMVSCWRSPRQMTIPTGRDPRKIPTGWTLWDHRLKGWWFPTKTIIFAGLPHGKHTKNYWKMAIVK